MLKVNDLFVSIDGEVNHWGQGGFSYFIRLAGCKLRCDYCDTKQAQSEKSGVDFTILSLYKLIQESGLRKVTITGGEPFDQTQTISLIDFLVSQDLCVSIETNGTHDIRKSLPKKRTSVVFDYKLEYQDKMVFNPASLLSSDYIKIIITNFEEYEQAKHYINAISTSGKIYLSPAFGLVDPIMLVNQLMADRLYNVGINMQLHKIIFDEESRC